MGLIKEPKGVDFIIESKPLKKKKQQELSKFIRDYKTKHSTKKSRKKADSLTRP